jgi:hypothetical protein
MVSAMSNCGAPAIACYALVRRWFAATWRQDAPVLGALAPDGAQDWTAPRTWALIRFDQRANGASRRDAVQGTMTHFPPSARKRVARRAWIGAKRARARQSQASPDVPE